jgi:hypothetical protein
LETKSSLSQMKNTDESYSADWHKYKTDFKGL